MFKKNLRIDIIEGTTEHISFTGRKVRRPTVLIRFGSYSMSKKAFLLGLTLVLLQVLDGLLTYAGLSLLGIHMEGNVFLRELMHAYGTAVPLVIVKILAILIVLRLTFFAHNRRWIRPLIFALIVIYFVLAVAPWTYLISKARAERDSGRSALPQSATH